jgi:hypothetical protein
MLFVSPRELHPHREEEVCAPKWPGQLCWRKRKLLVEPPMPERSKDRVQTKCGPWSSRFGVGHGVSRFRCFTQHTQNIDPQHSANREEEDWKWRSSGKHSCFVFRRSNIGYNILQIETKKTENGGRVGRIIASCFGGPISATTLCKSRRGRLKMAVEWAELLLRISEVQYRPRDQPSFSFFMSSFKELGSIKLATIASDAQ